MSFYAGYIRRTFRLTPTTTKRHLRTLVAYGYAKIVGGGPRTGYEYELVDEDKRLSEAVENALDQVLEKLKTEWAGGPGVGQSKNGPPKEQKIKELAPVGHKN